MSPCLGRILVVRKRANVGYLYLSTETEMQQLLNCIHMNGKIIKFASLLCCAFNKEACAESPELIRAIYPLRGTEADTHAAPRLND